MRILAYLLAAVLYGIGWVAGIIAAACAWLWSAVVVGYVDARAWASPRERGHDAPARELRAVPPYPAGDRTG